MRQNKPGQRQVSLDRCFVQWKTRERKINKYYKRLLGGGPFSAGLPAHLVFTPSQFTSNVVDCIHDCSLAITASLERRRESSSSSSVLNLTGGRLQFEMSRRRWELGEGIGEVGFENGGHTDKPTENKGGLEERRPLVVSVGKTTAVDSRHLVLFLLPLKLAVALRLSLLVSSAFIPPPSHSLSPRVRSSS